MEISISIEPFLSGEVSYLKQYMVDIIALSRKLAQKNLQISLHFDYFKPNLEVFRLVQSYTDQIQIDLHLMSEPAFSLQGFRSVSFDAKDIKNAKNESILNNFKTVNKGQLGLVLDLGYQVKGLEDLIREAAYIIIMTVKCGKSGQVFEPVALSLIDEVRALNPDVKIIIDGGVNQNNVFLLKKAGVNVAVVGNFAKKCYENGDFEIGINRLLRD